MVIRTRISFLPLHPSWPLPSLVCPSLHLPLGICVVIRTRISLSSPPLPLFGSGFLELPRPVSPLSVLVGPLGSAWLFEPAFLFPLSPFYCIWDLRGYSNPHLLVLHWFFLCGDLLDPSTLHFSPFPWRQCFSVWLFEPTFLHCSPSTLSSAPSSLLLPCRIGGAFEFEPPWSYTHPLPLYR